jgi:hypothetical protein
MSKRNKTSYKMKGCSNKNKVRKSNQTRKNNLISGGCGGMCGLSGGLRGGFRVGRTNAVRKNTTKNSSQRKTRSNSKSNSKSNSNSNSKSKLILKGGFVGEDFINLGRQLNYNVGSAVNALSGVPSSVNPLPWKDQFPTTAHKASTYN